VFSLAAISLPLLLEAVGRDATLTGRTDIWPVFFNRALEKPLLGWGPGTFTYPSYATADLLQRFASLGTISSPHNIFIAVLGDSGILGFLSFVLPLLYFTLVVPFQTGGRLGLLSLAVGAASILHGFAESPVIFGFSMNWIMLFLVLLFLDDKHVSDAHESSEKLGDPIPVGLTVAARSKLYSNGIPVLGRQTGSM
jgi:O-antigen ligase